jgi:hypothetical protein
MFLLGIFALLILSLFTWQQNTFTYQLWIQLSMALLVMLLAIRAIADTRRQNRMFVAVVSEQGEWVQIDKHHQSSWQVTDKSRVTSQVLWIHLLPKVGDGKPQWLWVFNDQVSEQDYRRLCRCIIYLQQTS